MSESVDLTLAEAKECLGIDSSALDGEITAALNSSIASFSVSVGDPELINRHSDLVSMKKSIERMLVWKAIYHDSTQDAAIAFQTQQLQAYAGKKKLEEDIRNGSL